MPPGRVIDLFGHALAGLGEHEVVQRLGKGGGLAAMTETVQAAARGEAPDPEVLERLAAATGDADEGSAGAPLPDLSEPLPPEALDALGSVLAGSGVDASSVARALAGVAPPKAPEGMVAGPGGTLKRELPKVGRNEPCPCGSGKKYKRCHGRR
jgi:hypothetical protein